VSIQALLHEAYIKLLLTKQNSNCRGTTRDKSRPKQNYFFESTF
jgi:hypothetical protein